MLFFSRVCCKFAWLLAAPLPVSLSAQLLPYLSGNIGFNAGVQIQVGSHQQRVGLLASAYYVKNAFNTTSELRYYYSFKALGPKQAHGEMVFAQSVLYGYGKQRQEFNPFFSVTANHSSYSNSIVYTYFLYFNKIATTQQTGLIGFQFNNYTVLIENDLFARPSLDRFRTGAAVLQYQYNYQWQLRVKTMLWTGQMGGKKKIASTAIPSGCIMDTLGAVHANTSHGILAVDFNYLLNYAQQASVSAGIDAEQVRNVIQNKIMHDQVFLPKKFRRYKNCHIPVLDSNQQSYMYLPEQRIRPAKAFLQAGLNEPIIY